MTEREQLESSFTKLYTGLAKLDLGARGALITETIVLCKQTVLEVFDGPEIPVRDYNVYGVRLMKLDKEVDRLRKELSQARRQLVNVRLALPMTDDGALE